MVILVTVVLFIVVTVITAVYSVVYCCHSHCCCCGHGCSMVIAFDGHCYYGACLWSLLSLRSLLFCAIAGWWYCRLLLLQLVVIAGCDENKKSVFLSTVMLGSLET